MLKFLSHVVIVCVSDTVNGKYYEGCSKSYPPEYDITPLNKLIFYNNKFFEYDLLSSVHLYHFAGSDDNITVLFNNP